MMSSILRVNTISPKNVIMSGSEIAGMDSVGRVGANDDNLAHVMFAGLAQVVLGLRGREKFRIVEVTVRVDKIAIHNNIIADESVLRIYSSRQNNRRLANASFIEPALGYEKIPAERGSRKRALRFDKPSSDQGVGTATAALRDIPTEVPR